MDKTPKTIEIFLTNGTPMGTKIVTLGNRNIKCISVPRNKVTDFFHKKEFAKPAIYFLFSLEPEDNGLFRVYIGKTMNFIDRVSFHNNKNNKKDFWDIVVAFFGENLDLDYLEGKCIELAESQKRCILENGGRRKEYPMVESHKARMDEYLSYLNMLLQTLGYPIFSTTAESYKKQEELANESDILVCSGKEAQAKGIITDEGFKVLQGSTASKEEAKLPSYNKLKKFLIKERILIKHPDKDNLLVFSSNYIFKRPSSASNVILAFSNNGRERWKNLEGKTLSEIENLE